MKHAIIIGGDERQVDLLEESLWSAGYHSILEARDEDEAWSILRTVHPALIVVAPDESPGLEPDNLYLMSDVSGAPVIVSSAQPAKALHGLGPAPAAAL